MPAASSIARRYAEAYFELARDADDVGGWREQLAAVSDALSGSDVASALANPRLPLAERVRTGLTLLEGVSEPARNLARLLIERRRASILPQVVTHYDALADREAGIVRADVTAAVPVDEELHSKVASLLSDSLGRPVETVIRTDPSIIGGLVIRIGDRVIDDSVRTHLQQLQAALA